MQFTNSIHKDITTAENSTLCLALFSFKEPKRTAQEIKVSISEKKNTL